MIKPSEFRQLRIQAGLSQAELADMINKTQSYIARLEGGSLNPSLSVVSDILKATQSWSRTSCAEIMTRDPVTIDARDSVMQAVRKMREGDYSQLPVVRTGRILGIITMKDIFNNLELNLEEISVETIMSPSGSPMVDESTPVEAILPILNENHVVLVQKHGRLIGIITESDLPRIGIRTMLETLFVS